MAKAIFYQSARVIYILQLLSVQISLNPSVHLVINFEIGHCASALNPVIVRIEGDMKGMSLIRTCLWVAVRVMRYYNSVPLTGAMPVMAPFRGCANHQFTGGYDSLSPCFHV